MKMTLPCLMATTGALFASLALPVTAQEKMVWSEIPCAQSKLVAPAGVKCRSTQVYSGSSAAISGAGVGGQRQRWASSGIVNGSKIYVFCLDEVGVGSHAMTSPLEHEIKSLSPYAKNATGFSEQAFLDGGSYETFTSEKGEKCVAVRKLGPVQSGGYKWILAASKCAPSGKALSQTDIAKFISQIGFRG